jgi:hypothetical protein
MGVIQYAAMPVSIIIVSVGDQGGAGQVSPAIRSLILHGQPQFWTV